MSAKELFLKDKDLRQKLEAVVHSDWFQTCLVYAVSECTAQTGPVPEGQLSGFFLGMERFKYVLLDLPNEQPTEPPYPTPGLDHSLEIKKKTDKKEK